MEIYNKTAHELSKMLREKDISAVELTQSYFNRINDVDDKVKAFLALCEEKALKEAAEVQALFDKGEELPALAGIPMAIKDNICTEGINTTCASRMLENFVPPYNATVYNKLLNDKAILLGKVNMDEFAMGGSTEHSYFKKTANPWNLNKVPGGSSGGSAASVAANEATFSLGSDTGGSIRQPAMFCGVVGMKPTYGAVSRFGLVAFASSLDQIGPLTKDVTDCALVMNTICGYDKLDSTSANVKYPDYTKALKNDVKGMKIGVPKQFFDEGVDPEVAQSVRDALEVYKKLGAEVEEFDFPINEYGIPAYYIIACAEASSNLARYDGIKYGYRTKESVEDLLSLYKQSRSEGFGDEVKNRIMLGTYALSSGYYDAYYKKALQARTLISQKYLEAFEKYDFIAGPVSPSPAFDFGSKSSNPLEMYLVDLFTVTVNIAGLPGMSLPCGFNSEGLPLAIQLIGKPFGEETILQAAYTYEQNTEWHLKRAEVK